MKQPFDDTTKSYYRRFFEERGLYAIQQYEIFSRSRSIDLVVESQSASIPQLQETIFGHFRRLNALEFKGINDPLTTIDFNRIMMRAWGMGAVDETISKKKQISPRPTPQLPIKEISAMLDQRTVTIICVTRPDTILKTLREMFAFQPTDEPGVYCNHTHAIPVWIIHPSELALKPKNFPLLPLARGKKLEQFVELCIRHELVDYLQLTMDIGLATNPSIIWQKIMEMIGMELTIKNETWPYIDEFFRKVPEAFEKLPFLQEAMQEARQKALSEGQRFGEERGSLLTKREILLRMLRRKFERVPSSVIELIEATTDHKQLDDWMDQSIMADSFAEIEFEASES